MQYLYIWIFSLVNQDQYTLVLILIKIYVPEFDNIRKSISVALLAK